MDFKVFLSEKDGKQHTLLQKLKGYRDRSLIPKNSQFREAFFQFENSEIWHSLDSEVKPLILENLSQGLLQETLHIEMAGMAYASKMSLLSENIDQRQLFCEFSAQESKHFEWVRPYVADLTVGKASEFAQFISYTVKTANFLEGLLVVQTTLEGWGLHYYQELQKACTSAGLQQVFLNILKDEAKHHSGGIAMLGGKLDQVYFEGSDFAFQTLKSMAESIAIGPLSLCESVLPHVKGLNPGTVEAFLLETNAYEVAVSKMLVFKHLLGKAVTSSVLDQWERMGIFQVLSIGQMTDLACSRILETGKSSPDNPKDLHL